MQSVSNLKNDIFETLEKYLKEYDPKIKVLKYQGELAKQSVVFKELSNTLNSKDGTNTQNLRSVNYEIRIYTTTIGKKNSIEYAEEIQDVIINVMENIFGLSGGFQGSIPNANTNNATITILRYGGTWFMERNFVYN